MMLSPSQYVSISIFWCFAVSLISDLRRPKKGNTMHKMKASANRISTGHNSETETVELSRMS